MVCVTVVVEVEGVASRDWLVVRFLGAIFEGGIGYGVGGGGEGNWWRELRLNWCWWFGSEATKLDERWKGCRGAARQGSEDRGRGSPWCDMPRGKLPLTT